MNPVEVPDVVAVGRYQCPDCKREGWRRRAVSFFAWLAVGFAIGAVFCGAWAIAEWGWAR